MWETPKEDLDRGVEGVMTSRENSNIKGGEGQVPRGGAGEMG